MIKKAILCIDDDKTILDSLKSQLQRNFNDGFVFEFAEDAEEGFEVINDLNKDNTKILVLISDWLMPGMKDDEFLITVHKKYPGIVKVMLTGQADGLAIKRAHDEANLFRHIAKPWNETELIQTIRSGLNL